MKNKISEEVAVAVNNAGSGAHVAGLGSGSGDPPVDKRRKRGKFMSFKMFSRNNLPK